MEGNKSCSVSLCDMRYTSRGGEFWEDNLVFPARKKMMLIHLADTGEEGSIEIGGKIPPDSRSVPSG